VHFGVDGETVATMGAKIIFKLHTGQFYVLHDFNHL
jgi:hypothetical protein